MVNLARRRAADDRVRNVNFEEGNAQVYPLGDSAFDVAISRTRAMFVGDTTVSFTNIGRALRTDGQLALLAWQPSAQNEWIRELAGA